MRQIVEIYERNLVIVIDIIRKSTLQEEAFTVAEKEKYVAIPDQHFHVSKGVQRDESKL